MAEQKDIDPLDRVYVIRSIIRSYDNPDDKKVISELLSDLRHYCDSRGYDFAALDDAARAEYVSEISSPMGRLRQKQNAERKPYDQPTSYN